MPAMPGASDPCARTAPQMPWLFQSQPRLLWEEG